MPFLSLFHPPSPAPLLIDTAGLHDMADDQLRGRLDGIAQQRRLAAEEHAQRVAPLLERREKLLAEAAKLESEIAYQGILRGDEERALDRDVQRLQAELRGRVVDLDGDVEDVDDVDQAEVQHIVGRLKSGKLKRGDFIASTESEIQAQLEYDTAVERLRSFARQAVQSVSATGHMPDLPEDLRGFDDQLRHEICAREGLRS